MRYRLRAIDADGLRSFFSEPLEVAGPDLGLVLTASPTGYQLRWDPALGGVRVKELRSVLPDRELASAAGTNVVELPPLDPGTRLEVAFAGGDAATAPPVCRMTVPGGS